MFIHNTHYTAFPIIYLIIEKRIYVSGNIYIYKYTYIFIYINCQKVREQYVVICDNQLLSHIFVYIYLCTCFIFCFRPKNRYSSKFW